MGFPMMVSCGLPRRTSRAALRPCFDERARLLLRARHRRTAEARLPRPADQRVLADVVDQLFDFAAAIAGRVLDLGADLGERLAFPTHLPWREVPFRVARYAARLEIGVAVTGLAPHR